MTDKQQAYYEAMKRKGMAKFLSCEAMKAITPLEDYVTSMTPILLRCHKCSNTWKARPHNIMNQSYGCPVCVTPTDYKKLYILVDNEHGLIKVGIAKNPNRRKNNLNSDIRKAGYPYRFEVYRTFDLSHSKTLALDLETKAHEKYRKRKVFGDCIFNGATEIFKLKPKTALGYIHSQIKC